MTRSEIAPGNFHHFRDTTFFQTRRSKQHEGAAMAGHYREPNREQHFLLPVDMADWVDKGDLVHLVLDAVGEMKLPTFDAHYQVGGVGAPAFAPG